MSQFAYIRTPRLPARAHHHHRIHELCEELGIEKPTGVFWEKDAEDVIERLEHMQRQPMLEGFRA